MHWIIFQSKIDSATLLVWSSLASVSTKLAVNLPPFKQNSYRHAGSLTKDSSVLCAMRYIAFHNWKLWYAYHIALSHIVHPYMWAGLPILASLDNWFLIGQHWTVEYMGMRRLEALFISFISFMRTVWMLNKKMKNRDEVGQKLKGEKNIFSLWW